MQYNRILALLACLVVFCSVQAAPIQSMVVFGDSLSDNGNTAELFETLRHEKNSNYLVKPLKAYLNYKLDSYAEKHRNMRKPVKAAKYYMRRVLDNYIAEWVTRLTAALVHLPVLPPSPYWHYRFSNGKVWNEYVAEQLGLDTRNPKQYVNYAYGGSWAMTLDPHFSWRTFLKHPKREVRKLINGKLIPPSFALTTTSYVMHNQKIDPNTVFFIFYGGNDYLNVFNNPENYNQTTLNTYVNKVVDNIASSLKHLSRHGARRFVVLGLPQIGYTPRFLYTPEQDLINQAIAWHNAALETVVKSLGPDSQFVDLATIFENLINNCSIHGIDQTTQACTDATVFIPGDHFIEETDAVFANNTLLNQLIALGKKVQAATNAGFIEHAPYYVCPNPENYIFWDQVHPTTVAHALLAGEVVKQLTTLR